MENIKDRENKQSKQGMVREGKIFTADTVINVNKRLIASRSRDNKKLTQQAIKKKQNVLIKPKLSIDLDRETARKTWGRVMAKHGC